MSPHFIENLYHRGYIDGMNGQDAFYDCHDYLNGFADGQAVRYLSAFNPELPEDF